MSELIEGRIEDDAQRAGLEPMAAVSGGHERVRQARSAGNPSPLLTQPEAASGSHALLDAHAFRNAVCAYLAARSVPAFTLVVLKPLDATLTRELGDMLLRIMRLRSGDLAGCLEGALAVYLHGATPREASCFVARVSSAWRHAAGAPLAIGVATHPAEEYRVFDLLSADWRDDEALTLLGVPAGYASA